MCLKPLHITNKSLVVGQSDWTPYDLMVPCNNCPECRQLMRDQWYLRAYWQAKYTFDKKGYVYYITMTYNDQSVPRISDFVPQLKNSILDHMCFSYRHTRRFWCDLRQGLERAGFSSDFAYFMSGEYGTDPARTHRPHYHALIYVTDPRLDVLTLHDMVCKYWKYGYINGHVSHTNAEILHNTFGPNYNTMDHAMAVTGYVMKYVLKDSDYDSRMRYRISVVMDRLVADKYKCDDFDWHKVPECRQEFRSMLNLVKQFHRQSQHFGEYALTQVDMQELMQDGTMAMPDSDEIVKHIPIPMYYSRKIFSEQVKLEDGRRVWVPTELGKRYKYRRTYRSAALMAQKFQKWFDNIDTDFILSTDVFKAPDGSQFSFDAQECFEAKNALKHKIMALMAGRSFLDFATYVVFYKGRVIPRENLIDPQRPHPRDIVSMALSSDPRHTQNVYRYRVYVDSVTGEEVPMMSLVDDSFFDAKAWARCHGKSMDVDVITVDVFKKHMVVNDTTFIGYEGFDELLDLYYMCNSIRCRRKKNVEDTKDRVEKVLKQVYAYK